eukprot:m.333410 g.333410  ORF g.333410 m.333410 type:complete len:143 (+) comp17142_c0_seq1:389-817(+)
MGLSAEDKKTCEEAFKLYEDEPGKILAYNLGEVMRAPGANPTEEELEKIVSNKQHITFEEYMKAMESQTMHEDPSTKLAGYFTIFDAEGTGRVDTTEMRSVLNNLGERFSQEEMGQVMLMADIDEEGKMQIEDIVKFCKQYK